jgi:prolyl 4-hydroxylase
MLVGRRINVGCHRIDRRLSTVISHNLSALDHVELSSAPQLYAINSFFDQTQCESLIADAKLAGLRSSKIASDEFKGYRTSSSAYLARAKTQWVLERISEVLQVCPDNCEDPQVTLYAPGEQYKAHLDVLDTTSRDLQNGGQRVATVLVYLNECKSGVTSFPHLDIEVAPRTGKSLIFFPSSVDGAADPLLLHEAKPVAESDGEKWVMQVWVRQRSWLGAHKESNRFDAAVGSLAASNIAVLLGVLLLISAKGPW